MPRGSLPALLVCLLIVGCSGDVPVTPTTPGTAGGAEEPAVREPPPPRLLELAPPEQIAGPGEKPIYGLPLEHNIKVPETPEAIRRPSPAIAGQ